MSVLDWFRRKKKPEAPPPDPQALFSARAEALALEMPGVTAVVPEGDFSLKVTAHGKDHTVSLGAFFQETREVSPDEREARLRWFLDTVLNHEHAELSWEDAQPRLRCALRSPMHVVELMANDVQLCRDVLPCLREHVVIDSEHAIAYVTSERFQAWDVDRDEVFRIARDNLARSATPEIEVYSETPDRIWSVETGDTYESSLLLIPGFLASFRERVEGRPIAIVPERSTLFIAGDARPETVIWMAEKAEREYAASSRSLSTALYTVDEEGTVVPYLPDSADEGSRRAREAHVRFLGTEYANQKQLLEEHHAKNEIDLFVATFTGAETEDGELISYCTWAQAVDGLLPQTDQVVVFKSDDPKAGYVRVKWEDAVRIGGDALRREGAYFPPRWRTVRPLTEAEQARMASVRLDP